MYCSDRTASAGWPPRTRQPETRRATSTAPAAASRPGPERRPAAAPARPSRAPRDAARQTAARRRRRWRRGADPIAETTSPAGARRRRAQSTAESGRDAPGRSRGSPRSRRAPGGNVPGRSGHASPRRAFRPAARGCGSRTAPIRRQRPADRPALSAPAVPEPPAPVSTVSPTRPVPSALERRGSRDRWRARRSGHEGRRRGRHDRAPSARRRDIHAGRTVELVDPPRDTVQDRFLPAKSMEQRRGDTRFRRVRAGAARSAPTYRAARRSG